MYDHLPLGFDARDPEALFGPDARHYEIPYVVTSPFGLPIDRREYPDDLALLDALGEQRLLEDRMLSDMALGGARAAVTGRGAELGTNTERGRQLAERPYYKMSLREIVAEDHPALVEALDKAGMPAGGNLEEARKYRADSTGSFVAYSSILQNGTLDERREAGMPLSAVMPSGDYDFCQAFLDTMQTMGHPDALALPIGAPTHLEPQYMSATSAYNAAYIKSIGGEEHPDPELSRLLQELAAHIPEDPRIIRAYPLQHVNSWGATAYLCEDGTLRLLTRELGLVPMAGTVGTYMDINSIGINARTRPYAVAQGYVPKQILADTVAAALHASTTNT